MKTMRSILGCVTVLTVMVMFSAGCASHDDLSRKDSRAPIDPPAPPRAIAEPISPELRGAARVEINDALASSDSILRANAIEALQNSVGADAGDEIIRALKDPSSVVRFAAAMASGTLRLEPAQTMLMTMVDDSDASVRVAVRYALHRLGDHHLSHELEKLATNPDGSVRANTALALGLLGEKSALNILRSMTSDREPAVRLQVAEAMWRLGDADALENLVAASISQAPDDQIVAILALAGPKDQRIAGHIYGKLVGDYPEVSLAAARAMGELGSDVGYSIAMKGSQSNDPRQRAMAALALGAIARSDAQPALHRLLDDQDPNVKLAAATAILQLKPPRGT